MAPVDDLMAQEKWDDALALLQPQVPLEHNDPMVRALIRCLLYLGNFDEARKHVDKIRQKEPVDLLREGWLYFDGGAPDKALPPLEAYVKARPTDAEGHCLLGRVREDYRLTAQNGRQLAADCYRAAIACDKCSPDAYLRLAGCMGWDDAGRAERVKVLEAAYQRHPTSNKVRLEFAHMLIPIGDRTREALEVLTPLIEQKVPLALWRAYEAKRQLKLPAEAARYIEILEQKHLDDVSIDWIIGDLDLLAGNYSDAFRRFANAKDQVEGAKKIMLRFAEAEALLGMGKEGPALDVARQAALEYIELDDDGDLASSPIRVDDDYEMFDRTRSLVNVCETLMSDESEFMVANVDDELRGAMLYAKAKQGSYTAASTSDLSRSLEFLEHHAIAKELSNRYFDSGALGDAVRMHLRAGRWMLRKGHRGAQVEEAIGRFEYCQSYVKSNEDCAAILSALEDELPYVGCDEEFEHVVMPTYAFVREAHRSRDLYKELADVASTLLERAEDDTDLLWDRAYALHCMKEYAAAEAVYRELLEIAPDNASALHNLALLRRDDKDLAEAIELSERAAILAPKNTNITSLTQRLKRAKIEEDRREDFLRTAPLRWPRLDYYKRQVACALSMINGFSSHDELAQLAGCAPQFISGHLQALEKEGIVLFPEQGRFEINPHVRDLIDREKSHAVVTKLVHGDETIAFRPTFGSKQEYSVYQILMALFPNHLVFPNMALQAIFQFERIKELVDKDEFTAFMRTQVDFCVVSTANYLPLLGFEVDSIFHDQPEQKARDEKKEKIFKTGGVPLLRLQGHGRPTPEALRTQIVQEVTALGAVIRKKAEKSILLTTLEREIDFESFGERGWVEEGRWLTVTEAAKITGINAGLISRAADAGELKSNGLTGRGRKIDSVGLNQWTLAKADKESGQESDAKVERLVATHVPD